MRQSHLFTKTSKSTPREEVAKNAILLTQAGFVHKEMAGVYTYLPLGLRVFKKIEQIIREEMNAIGGQELVMTALQPKELWEKTDRWSDEASDVWFRTELKNGTGLGLGWTHEEQVTNLMRDFVNSYKHLPALAYQIQTKFRNETRAKSGIMRCREFVMKDLYSFARTEEEHQAIYEQVKEAYHRIFARIGIGEKTYLTFASGGAFSKYSHEFQTITDAGEDTIFVDEERNIAVNQEVLTDDVLTELGLTRESLVEKTAAEVGNIFSLGTRFSAPMGLTYTDEHGEQQPVIMGCYGIGPGRVLGVVVETHADDRGLVWPKAVAPFPVHLVSLCTGDDVAKADALYLELQRAGIDVLYDDRDARAGEKFADSDLIGIPLRVVVSAKTLEKDEVEVKVRTAPDATFVARKDIVSYLSA